MAEPMSGYTGFGNPANFNSTTYTNGPLLSNAIRTGDAWTYPVMMDTGNGPWQRSAASNYATYCCGPDGNNFLEMNTGVFGSASLWQDFPAYGNGWSNYTASSTFINTPDTWTVRARIRSTCGSALGTLAIWAINGPAQEAGSTPFVANGQWQWFIATTRFAANGHNRLRPIIYMDTANCNYDFDNVTMQRNYINNSSFESGFNYWTQRYPGNCTSYYGIYSGGAPDNSSYLEINRGTCPGTGTDVSFYQDVGAYTQIGAKFYYRLRVRRPGARGGQVNIHLWALWSPISSMVDQRLYVPADGAWHEYEYSGTVPQSGNTIMRAEIYLYDQGNFDFDGMQIYGGAGEP